MKTYRSTRLLSTTRLLKSRYHHRIQKVSGLRATGLIGALLLAQLSCNLGPTAVTETPEPSRETPTTVSSPTPTIAEPTATTAPPATAGPTSTSQPTATSGPQCTVLQDLNLRPGPGTAYDPPIRALPAQTILTPTGFEPDGIPEGSWVQVRDDVNNQVGWVSAGAPFVSCNIDLTTLPSVAVPPPPQPPPPDFDTSDPDGTLPENLIFQEDFDSQYLFRLFAYDANTGVTDDGAGINAVIFTITDSDNQVVFENSEETAGFCVFGGGEPNCNPWTFEDFTYKWAPGGEVVLDSTYNLEVRVILDDENSEQGRWDYTLTIDLP
jgi:hypothetical protein